MIPINNYNTYTNLMKNGFYDKLFFADKLLYDWNSFLDYGCADGFLTRMVSEAFPYKKIYGYDSDPSMIQNARLSSELGTHHCPGIHQNILYSHKISEIYKQIDIDRKIDEAKGKNVDFTQPKIDVLFLSSVLHEIHTYNSPEEIENFWKFVFDSGFKYIVIRDMMPDILPEKETPVELYDAIIKYCSNNSISTHLKQFENAFGSIANYKNCLHFLLKYKYVSTNNWERESVENYFSMDTSSFANKIPANYRIEHQEHFTLPFNKWQWENDFGIFIDEKIHAKIILRKL